MADIGGVHHISLTVRDVSHSKGWYRRVLGLSDLFEGDDDEVSFVVLTDSYQLMLGLRQYREGSGDRFDEFRTGLDHLAFAVSDQAQLRAWEAPVLTSWALTIRRSRIRRLARC